MLPTHRYLSNLTPLRGIAALWVVIFHFSEIVVKFVPVRNTLLLTKGYLMVDLFFIMSGFIICHVYQDSFRTSLSWGNFKQFMVARFARIYPLHLFTLILSVAIFVPAFGFDDGFDNPHAIITHLLMLHSFGIHKTFTWNVPAWSISAEWWAYLFFPLLVLFLNRKKSLAVWVLLFFSIVAYLGIMFWIPRTNFIEPNLTHGQNLDVSFDFGYLRGLAGFIAGMLVYKAYEIRLYAKIFSKDISAVLIMLGATLCMHWAWNDGVAILFFIAIVYTFALNAGRLHTFCNYRVLQYLGKISYSIYLLQIFPLIPLWLGLKLPGLVYTKDSASAGFWTGLGYCLIYVILVVGVASLTYYTIEKPCRKWINARWGKEKMPVYA